MGHDTDAGQDALLPEDILETIRKAASEAAEEYAYDDTLRAVSHHVGRLELLHETALAVLAETPGAVGEFERVLERVLPNVEPEGPTGFGAWRVSRRPREDTVPDIDAAGPDSVRSRDPFSGERGPERPSADREGRTGRGEFGPDRRGPSGSGDSRPGLSGRGAIDGFGGFGFPRSRGFCTISIDGYGSILDAVARITDLDGVADPESPYWRYTERVGAVVDAAEPVAMLYERATAYLDDDGSAESFTAALFALGGRDRTDGFRARAVGTPSPSGGRQSGAHGRVDTGLNAVLDVGDVGDVLQSELRSSLPGFGGVPGPLGPPGSGPLGPPFGRGPGLGFDPEHCPTERNRRKWSLAACLLAIREGGDTYRVDRIENTTRSTTATGCVGDTVVIHGEGFGDEGSVSFHYLHSAAVESWSDTAIEVTIPDNATTGDVRVCVQPAYVQCENVAACLPEATDSRPFFTVVRPPTIHEISVDGDPVVDGDVTVEACKNTRLEVTATTTDIVIRDDDGTPILQSLGNAFQRRTAGRNVQSETAETYTVEVATMCGTDSETFVVERERRLSAALNGPLTPGDLLNLDVEVSCPAPAGGLDVAVSVVEGGLTVNSPLTIPEGLKRARFSTLDFGPCGPLRVEASTDDGRQATAETMVYEPATVDAVSGDARACRRFDLEILGSCFHPDPDAMTVHIEAVDGTSTATEPVDTVSGAPMGTELTASVGPLAPGDYSVRVDIDSGPVSLPGGSTAQFTVSESVVSIHSFDNSGAVPPCSNIGVTLSWDVSGASEVSITDDDGGVVTTETYPRDCQRRSDSKTVIISDPPATFTLEAVSFDGGVTKAETTTVNEFFTNVAEASEIVVFNPRGSGGSYDIYALVGQNRSSLGTVDEDDAMRIDSLSECTTYNLRAYDSGKDPETDPVDSEIPKVRIRSSKGPQSWVLPAQRI